MGMLLYTFVAAVFLTMVIAADRKCQHSASVSKRMVGGKEANPLEWGSQVSLQFVKKRRYGMEYYHICGATIINERWVLTAAHCKRIGERYRRMIFAGVIRLVSYKRNETSNLYKKRQNMRANLAANNPNLQMVKIERWFVHENYSQDFMFNNDLALIKLKRPLTMNRFIYPVSLPDVGQIFSTGKRCWSAGWGATQANDTEPSSVIHEVPLSLTSQSTCRKLVRQWLGPRFDVTDSMLCAGKVREQRGPCHHDSGSPLLCCHSNQAVLVGVVSYGYQCFGPTVFTNIPGFVDWIEDIISRK